MTFQILLEADLDLLKDSWHSHLRSRNFARSTVTNYLAAVRMLDEFLAKQGMPRNVVNIRREHIEAFLADILDHHKPATAASRYRALNTFWKWLIEDGEVTQSPLRNIKPPKVAIPEIPVMSMEDLKTLLNGCKRDKGFLGLRDHAMLRLFMTTGARRSEIADLALDQDSYQLRERQIRGTVRAPWLHISPGTLVTLSWKHTDGGVNLCPGKRPMN